MKKEPWIENITEEDMPNEDLKLVAGLCGVDVAMNLIDNLPGVLIRIPNSSYKRLKEAYILRNYDGTRSSLLKLAIICEVSDTQIYRILKKKKKTP